MKLITKGAIITGLLVALIFTLGYGIKYQQARANWPTLSTGITTSTHASVSVQVESELLIKRNLILTVRALTTNTGVVRISGTEAGAHSTSSYTTAVATEHFVLYPGESIGLFVENANDVWFTATAAEGIEYITEFE